ncbi:MAG: hypothetical protein DRP45_06540 [Candidatus Zixiibacteriota bacterium]|nr:MAG: hypothetical protein DRP45_06540 [candidate division Zixibacteria bacterium]
MSESRKTLLFASAAVILALLAFVVAPKRITPDAFLDQGEAFYPEFSDPNEATTLEVVGYDEASGTTTPFKVTFKGDRWTIPSHHDYPADGKDRLAQTAAGMIDIKKDDFRTSNVADHESCGVVDPLDESTAGLSGRGSRVSLKSEGDEVLADFIFGYEVPEREGFRFVRVPGQNRVYASRVNIDISTRFGDWIETNLLEIKKPRIEKIVLNDYSINERTLSVEQRGTLTLRLRDGEWTMSPNSGNKPLDSAKIEEVLDSLANLSIVGVRPKPEGLTVRLQKGDGNLQISQADMMSLRSKGFYFSQDGQLLSNEGEIKVHTNEGVIYTLRFGEVLYGSGMAVTAGLSSDDEDIQSESANAVNRYLFVTTDFKENYFDKPPGPSSTEFLTKPDSLLTDADKENKQKQATLDQWRWKQDNGRAVSSSLNERFAKWYYVISSDSFDKLHISSENLLASEEN